MRSFFSHSGLAGFYNLLTQKKIGIAGIIYLFFSISILFLYGINTNGEAIKYLEDAQHILDGQPFRIEFFSIFYVLYSLLISFFIHFSLGFKGVALFQILFSFVAGCCVYNLLSGITGDEKIAYAGFLVYLLCFPVQKWNFYLYTESLHTSFTVVGLYFFYCILYKGQFRRWWMFCILLLLIIFSRPVGIIFVLAMLVAWGAWLIEKKKKIIYYPLIIGFIAILIFILCSPFVFYFNPDSLRRMEVICQVPETASTLHYQEYNTAGLSSFLHVIFSEIGIKKFLLTGARKIGSFFGMMRSFYSLRQNIVLLFTGTLLYPLALAGVFFIKNTKGFYIKLFAVIYILITAGGIFFTCDEWSNRFITPVLPQVIILAGIGFYCAKNAFGKLKGSD